MITILKGLVDEVDNIDKLVGNFSRDMDSINKSRMGTKNEKRYHMNIFFYAFINRQDIVETDSVTLRIVYTRSLPDWNKAKGVEMKNRAYYVECIRQTNIC